MKNTKLVKFAEYPDSGIVVIKTNLRERKDHFVITIYKEDRKELKLSIGDILILLVDKKEFLRPIRKDFHVSLPKNLLGKSKHGDKINLTILQIAKQKKSLKRPSKKFKEDLVDLRSFIPTTTRHGYPLYVIPRSRQFSTVWFPVGGGVNHVTIKNEINADAIAGLLGFYFGDGSTSEDLQSFRITNCEPSTLNYCIQVLEELGIRRSRWKAQIIYSTNKEEIDDEIKNRCIMFWSKTLKLNKSNIVSVLKSKNPRETRLYGSARIFIDSSVLVEIFLHGLLKKIIPLINNPQESTDYKLLQSFMRGLLAAEGSVIYNDNGTIVKVGISYDPHSEELELYKKWLNNLGITFGKVHGNELLIYKYENMKKLKELGAFRLHETRNKKFQQGFMNYNHGLKIN